MKLMKTRVLWVEDSARLELRNLTAPIYISGKYDLNLAEDATSAVRYLQTKEYDAVILDMRLPPGMDEHWIKIYRERDEDKAYARLGMELANWMFNGHTFPYSPPKWIKPQHVGIFTVENDSNLHVRLRALKVEVFQHKAAGMPDTILIDIIRQIEEQKAKTGNNQGD
jgi:hypothetical protein